MKKRKTISIQFLKETVNRRLAESTCELKVRHGMIIVLESVLLKTGNYRGYCFLDPVTRQATSKVRVADESRRYYY
jgi:hypothetical protein